jgi:lipopolysaccharide/colanic/teichoic acid biosynthesis glycosyltransferase
VLALLILILLAPLFAVVMPLIKLTSAGPIFYGDLREGRNGRVFRCWKFRSMRTDANDIQRDLASVQQMDGPQFKMANDPRVTSVGRVLRRLNMDEIPQLWNIVRGEMSFVGPRPSPFRENQICVPWRHARLSVRPGITGLWQVCRHDRANGDFHQWIQYDLAYVSNVSLRVDASIFVATLATLGGRWPVPLSRILGKAAAARASQSTIQVAPALSQVSEQPIVPLAPAHSSMPRLATATRGSGREVA